MPWYRFLLPLYSLSNKQGFPCAVNANAEANRMDHSFLRFINLRSRSNPFFHFVAMLEVDIVFVELFNFSVIEKIDSLSPVLNSNLEQVIKLLVAYSVQANSACSMSLPGFEFFD